MAPKLSARRLVPGYVSQFVLAPDLLEFSFSLTRTVLPAQPRQPQPPGGIDPRACRRRGDDAGALPYGSEAGRNSTSCSAETRTTSSVSVISWSWSNSSLRRPAGETQKRQRVGSWVVLK